MRTNQDPEEKEEEGEEGEGYPERFVWQEGDVKVSGGGRKKEKKVENLYFPANAKGGKKLTGGRWVTTEDGHRIYLKDGKPVAGNPHVVKELKKEGGGEGGKAERKEGDKGGQEGGGESKGREADDPTTKRMREDVGKKFAKAADRSRGLSAEQKKEYAADAQEVIDKIPPAAVKAAFNNVDSVTFYKDADALSKATSGLTGDLAGEYEVAGLYVGGGTKGLHLDGGLAGDEAGTRKEIYAHEISHALDGPKLGHSSSKEWQAAYDREVKGGGLSNYARENAAEGFAEFGRLAYASEFSRQQLRERFPECTRYWESKGLL